MTWDVDPQWEAGLGLVGTLSAIALFVSPIKTFQRIISKRNTEDFPSFPYVSTFLNCFVWTIYALPFVTPNRLPPLITNVIGVVFQVVYLILFVRYAKDKAQSQVRQQLLALSAFLLLFSSLLFTAVPPASRSAVAGNFATLFTVVMFGAPLSSLSVVLRTRSVEFMPLPLSLMSFVCSTSWLAYGVYVQDTYVIVPNALGSLLGIIQLCIYYAVSREGRRKSEDNALDEENIPLQEVMMVEASRD
ncbi:hypothetical protein CLOM_g5649 [Closterium sp. NIES-68]|nr:hypothetical protein CLOM_g5649 [Closterium sp. NIES-68]GJP64002.1 hypothetical protein CLOP_g21039 [Closterium sp. NIES-67]